MVVLMITAAIGAVLFLAAIITIIILAGPNTGLDSICTTNSDCGSKLVCDTSVFLCKVERGAKCKVDEDCTAGSKCSSKKCVRDA